MVLLFGKNRQLIADKIIKTIITAIVLTIGPMEFSTNDENRNARLATTDIPKEANPYAKKKSPEYITLFKNY